jgi:thiosulfate/3-mercaptopyruvate sulfurtransferase
VHRTIVSPGDLAGMLHDPSLVILDARFSLDDEDWGLREYSAAHIPGARYANCATDLSGPVIEGVTGRRPFPDPEAFRRVLGEWGIGPDTQVVAYDAQNGLMAASRVWLMLRWMGHEAVAVLDGGIQAWLAASLPVDDAAPGPNTRAFTGTVRSDLLADISEVDAVRRDPGFCVLDSRSAEGYHGGGVYYDPVRGHIAGAGLADRADTLAADGRFRPAGDLRAHFTSIIGDVEPEQVIFYCGSGITAAQNVLAMEIAGLSGSRMYVGSWSEWITDASREVEL